MTVILTRSRVTITRSIRLRNGGRAQWPGNSRRSRAKCRHGSRSSRRGARYFRSILDSHSHRKTSVQSMSRLILPPALKKWVIPSSSCRKRNSNNYMSTMKILYSRAITGRKRKLLLQSRRSTWMLIWGVTLSSAKIITSQWFKRKNLRNLSKQWWSICKVRQTSFSLKAEIGAQSPHKMSRSSQSRLMTSLREKHQTKELRNLSSRRTLRMYNSSRKGSAHATQARTLQETQAVKIADVSCLEGLRQLFHPSTKKRFLRFKIRLKELPHPTWVKHHARNLPIRATFSPKRFRWIY